MDVREGGGNKDAKEQEEKVEQIKRVVAFLPTHTADYNVTSMYELIVVIRKDG